MKIAYCGYDFFHSSLRALMTDGHELIELFSWPTDNEYDFNTNVFDIAREARARISLSPMDVSDLRRLKDKGVDAVISAAYPYKIPTWSGYVSYALNVHPSQLPIGRGPWPLPWVILKGLKSTGVTIHEISSQFDRGDILSQASFNVSARETLESLSVRTQMCAERELLHVAGNLQACWENKRRQGDGTYWEMPKAKDRTINWQMDIESIDRIVRAFSKFEPFVFIDGIRHFVRAIDFWEETHHSMVGSVVHRTNRELVFAAKNGYVCLSNYVRAQS